VATSFVIQSLKYRRAHETDMIWIDYRGYESKDEAIEDCQVLRRNVAVAGPYRVVRRDEEAIDE